MCVKERGPLPSPQPLLLRHSWSPPRGSGWDLLAGVSTVISLSSHKNPSAPLSPPNCCIYHQLFSACSAPHSARTFQIETYPSAPPADGAAAGSGCPTGRAAEGPSLPAPWQVVCHTDHSSWAGCQALCTEPW